MLAVGYLSAQDTRVLARDHAWGDGTVWRPEWNNRAAGTEVLEDDLDIHLKNNKPQYLALFFTRRKVIRFGSEADILRHARFVLPESLDPPYDRRNVSYADREELARPHWFNVRLDEFAARIVRPDGTWGEVGAFASIDRDQVRTFRSMETAWTYTLDLQAIAPGDVVEVVWKYMVPYDVNAEHTKGWRSWEWMDNWARLTSWRIFFHGDLPIRHQRITLRYRVQHGLSIGGDSFYSITEDGDARTATWDQRDLPGCMDEVNARPGTDLPHIRVTLQLDDPRYWTRDRSSSVPFQQPYWLYVLRKREASVLWWQRVAEKNVPDRQNMLLNAFVERVVSGLSEGAPLRRMKALNDHIAARFSYRHDSLWFQDADRSLARMGDQVVDEQLREISRYDLYAKLAYLQGLDFSTAYPMDKRVGRVDASWLSPLWENDPFFLVGEGDGMTWMLPKRNASGTWADEVPFWWAGTPALLMNPRFILAETPERPLFIDVPADPPSANMRVLETELNVSLAARSVSGERRVLLCGQFSTVGRGAYLGDPMYNRVDAAYGDVLQGEGIRVTGPWEVRTNSSDPPFRFQAERPFTADDLLSIGEKGEWSIAISDLLAHAAPGNFIAQGRYLPFYWDFAQDDRSIVDLHFDRPMEFEEVFFSGTVAVTPNARIERSVSVKDSTHVRIESRLVVTSEREEVQDATDLELLLRMAGAFDLVLRGKPMNGRP